MEKDKVTFRVTVRSWGGSGVPGVGHVNAVTKMLNKTFEGIKRVSRVGLIRGPFAVTEARKPGVLFGGFGGWQVGGATFKKF